MMVSIQPKPNKGLVAALISLWSGLYPCFNPAEAEEGFSRVKISKFGNLDAVSIQPKPKKGLVEI